MTATISNTSKLLGSLHQVEDKIAAAAHVPTVPGANGTCQVCGEAARLCSPELLQQTVPALLGAPLSAVNGALCSRCANLAAQACHLHTQLQELDDQLRHHHISTLYAQLENRDSDELTSSKYLPKLQSEQRLDADELTCRLCAEHFHTNAALLRHLRSRHGAGTLSGTHCWSRPCSPCTLCRCGQTAAPAPERRSPPHCDSAESGQHTDRSGTVSPAAEDDTARRSPLSSAGGAGEQLACAACPQRFDSAVQRRRHQREVHPLLLAHACRICAKHFPSPSKLRIHEDSHAGARPHVCDVCGRRYLSAQKLHVHARSHTGERPFVCHMCGRTFASAAYLSQHEMTHTGRRPHQCHVCSKQFAQRGTMMKHVRNVHAAMVVQQAAGSADQEVTTVVRTVPLAPP